MPLLDRDGVLEVIPRARTDSSALPRNRPQDRHGQPPALGDAAHVEAGMAAARRVLVARCSDGQQRGGLDVEASAPARIDELLTKFGGAKVYEGACGRICSNECWDLRPRETH